MYTYQDFQKDVRKLGLAKAVETVVSTHRSTTAYQNAVLADRYDAQRNDTIMNYTKWLYSQDGGRAPDVFSSNHRLCSNFFAKLNTQRMTYSLGNGVTFEDRSIMESLGADFDTRLRDAGYAALIHGESFLFYDNGVVRVFKLTEFAPLLDERTGAIMAGVRFWRIDYSKPLICILYETDGYTRFETDDSGVLRMTVEKKAYIEVEITTPADRAAGNPPEIMTDNYGGYLPIVPFWGSRLHQSTLVGMQAKIDAYDLIQSGFANDMTDCSEIYWLVSGAGGMTESDLARFRDRLKLQHIASAPNADDVQITPYVQEIPYQARAEILTGLKESIYEDFGALDVHTIAAGATNDHIDAAYQSMDENADDYEYQVITAVRYLLQVAGIGDGTAVPTFKRNRLSNQKETGELILMFAQYLTDDMIRSKIPFLSSDEVLAANETAAAEDIKRVVPAYGNEEEDDV